VNETPKSVQVSIERYTPGIDRSFEKEQADAEVKDDKWCLCFPRVADTGRLEISDQLETISFSADEILSADVTQTHRSTGEGVEWLPCCAWCNDECIGGMHLGKPFSDFFRCYPCGQTGTRGPCDWCKCTQSCKDMNFCDLSGLKCCFPVEYCSCFYEKRKTEKSWANTSDLILRLKGGEDSKQVLSWATTGRGAEEFDYKHAIHPDLQAICEDKTSVARTLANVLLYAKGGETSVHRGGDSGDSEFGFGGGSKASKKKINMLNHVLPK